MTNLEIPVNNSLRVHVIDSLQNLFDKQTGIFFRIASFFDNPIEQFTAGHSKIKFCQTGKGNRGEGREREGGQVISDFNFLNRNALLTIPSPDKL